MKIKNMISRLIPKAEMIDNMIDKVTEKVTTKANRTIQDELNKSIEEKVELGIKIAGALVVVYTITSGFAKLPPDNVAKSCSSDSIIKAAKGVTKIIINNYYLK